MNYSGIETGCSLRETGVSSLSRQRFSENKTLQKLQAKPSDQEERPMETSAEHISEPSRR